MVRTCSLCQQPGAGACARCARPLCHEHTLPDERRCDCCEHEYALQLLGPVRGMLTIGAFFLVTLTTLVLACMTLLAVSGPASPLLGSALVATSLGSGAAAAFVAGRSYNRSQRLRFLDERRISLPAARLVRRR